MKYVLVEIELQDDGGCSPVFHFNELDNVNIIKIMDLTEEEAKQYQNAIEVFDNSNYYSGTNIYKEYRLIPEDRFTNKIPDELKLIDDVVIVCKLGNRYYLGTDEHGYIMSTKIFTIDYTKDLLRKECPNLSEVVIQNIDRNIGYYHHIGTKEDEVLHPHYLFFFDVNLKNILSEVTYREFTKQIKERAHKVFMAYINKYCDRNKEVMDDNNISLFFNEEEFYYPGAVPVK